MKHKAQIARHIGTYIYHTLKTVKEVHEFKETFIEDHYVKSAKEFAKRYITKKTGITFKEKPKYINKPYIAPDERIVLREAYLKRQAEREQDERKEKRVNTIITILVIALYCTIFIVIKNAIIKSTM